MFKQFYQMISGFRANWSLTEEIRRAVECAMYLLVEIVAVCYYNYGWVIQTSN
ncbi:hypothetical protein D3C81_1001990 [compost metagenome]